jgi:hypothetical protein
LRIGVHRKKKEGSKMMKATPCTLKQANELVEKLHRHHKPVTGHRFSIAAYIDGVLVGVAIVGRPVGREVPQYTACEVTRLASDGSKNVCSFLYSRCAQAARAMGFDFIQTYTLITEPGTSLRAAGWTDEGQVRKNGLGWNNRPGRKTSQPTIGKTRWRKYFTK